MSTIRKLTIALGITLATFPPLAGQITNSLYFMHGVPQSNRINPAHQPECGFYLGFPMLAPLRLEATSSSLAYQDLIYPHPTQDSLITFLHPLGSKQAFLDQLQSVNYVISDLGTSLASIGFRTSIGFFSLDVTTRVDGSVYYPRDLARLLLYGAGEGETYQFDGIGINLSAFNEASLGWSAEILDNLQVGVRGKLLFGMADLSTRRSELSLSTSQDLWNIRSDMMLNASLPFAQVQYDTDGSIEDVLLDEDIEDLGPFALPGYLFNTGNLGAGLDVGINYRPVEQLQLSASAVDIGFISWKDGVHDVTYVADYDFEGIEINPFELSEDSDFGDYLDSVLLDSLSTFLEFTQGRTYSKRLNTKLYLGASYYLTPNINFGILSRTDFLDGRVAQQFTASANLTTGRFINLTLSYSVMNSYLKNMGAGFSFNVGPLNLYLISDNILNGVFWPQEARSFNLWFGMNLVFGYRQFKLREYGDKPLIY
ncbi:MAG TPA: hypothetical protein ENO20_10970 [Bacteroides sp.]|nr:hypothetical protein [Bacteroides sp.]